MVEVGSARLFVAASPPVHGMLFPVSRWCCWLLHNPEVRESVMVRCMSRPNQSTTQVLRRGQWVKACGYTALILSVGSGACASVCGEVPVVESVHDLPRYVGRLVVVRGRLSSFKVPMVLGVSVGGVGPKEDGLMVEVVGILVEREVPLAEDIWESVDVRRGSFYVLRDPDVPNSLAIPVILGDEARKQQV